MKQDLHPKEHLIQAECTGCGHTFETLSTLPSISVGTCSQCHPFFTGVQKFVDTEGRVERFQRRRKDAKERKNTQA